MISSPLPEEAEKLLQSELNSGEKVIWTGQPLAKRNWWQDLPIVLFGIPWTAGSVFWIIMAFSITSHSSSTPSPFPFNLFSVAFPLFGVPFVLVGIWMLSTPFRSRRNMQRTLYAITDKRGIILSPSWRGAITILNIAPEDLSVRTRTQNPDGSGSIVFPRLTTTRRAAGPDGGTYEVTVGFANIPNVRDVDALIERTYGASRLE